MCERLHHTRGGAASYNDHVKGWAGLPGAELVASGLRDLDAGVESVPSLLVSVGAPRLRQHGIRVPTAYPSPEHRLYHLLRAEHGDAAHSRYNALVRRLVSFERALACVA
jgi:hypothetical protein